MRINSNRKIHKLKRDPYHLLLRGTVVLALVTVACFAIFYLSDQSAVNDYRAKVAAVNKLNETQEQEFNTRMNALRLSGGVTDDPVAAEANQGDLPFWEATLDDKGWRLEDQGYGDLENVTTVTMDRATLMTGGLLLVNPWHPLPTDFSDTTLISVGNNSGWKIAVTDGNVRLFPAAFEALQAMVAGAAESGLGDYIVREAYRSNDTQTELFNKQMEKLSAKYSGDILIEQTKKVVNYPGTSEYQSGLAFRMDIYNKEKPEVGKQKFQDSDQGKWFTNNGWKYGVIFRFPTVDFPTAAWEDKAYKTGVSTQMNLYRYVGKAHATAMRILDYCLEEYVEFLIDHPHLCIYEDGALRYEIYRVAAQDAATYDLPVPNPASSYTASLDNMGGVVLAYTYVQ